MKMLFYKILMRIRPALFADIFKYILKIKRRHIKISNMILYVDPVSDFGYSILRDEKYEPALHQYLSQTLRRGDCFIDIGANEGYFSVVASKLVEDVGRVVTIEPQGRLRSVIGANMALNNICNLIYLPYIISDKNDITDIYLSPSTNSGSSGLTQRTRYQLPTESVPTYTLVSIVNLLSLAKIDLIKIDVEGHEYEVIFGSKSLFQNHIVKNIALEYHPTELISRGKSVAQIDDFFLSCGYVSIQFDGFTVYSCLKS